MNCLYSLSLAFDRKKVKIDPTPNPVRKTNNRLLQAFMFILLHSVPVRLPCERRSPKSTQKLPSQPSSLVPHSAHYRQAARTSLTFSRHPCQLPSIRAFNFSGRTRVRRAQGNGHKRVAGFQPGDPDRGDPSQQNHPHHASCTPVGSLLHG